MDLALRKMLCAYIKTIQLCNYAAIQLKAVFYLFHDFYVIHFGKNKILSDSLIVRSKKVTSLVGVCASLVRNSKGLEEIFPTALYAKRFPAPTICLCFETLFNSVFSL